MKTLNRVLVLALVCILALSLAACTNTPAATEAPKTEPAKTEAPATEPAKTEAPATEPAKTEAPDDGKIDWTKYPAEFSAWTTGDLQTYLTDCELLGNDDFMLIEMSNELEQMSANAGFIYIDATGFTVNDTVIGFDPNTEAGAAMLETIRANHAIVVGEASVPVDALLGNFTFNYSTSLDSDYIAAFTAALKGLSEHYGIAPDFIPE